MDTSLNYRESATQKNPFREAPGIPRTDTDHTQLYFKDWGQGQPVVFSHGWPLTADAWDDQMVFLASHGCRCIAHDRRGHGRSSQPWNGNEMDTYADDLSALVEALDLRNRRLLDLRRSYEPYITGLARTLMMPTPSWWHQHAARDNWQASPKAVGEAHL